MSNELLSGKVGLVMGVANDRSIAWEIAKELDAAGAEIAFTYQNEQIGEKVIPLFEELDSPFYSELDVLDDENFAEVFSKLEDEVGELDFLVHSIAGGPKREDFNGKYLDTERDSFSRTMEISAYSYVKAMQLAYPMMKDRDAASLTLTYYGGEKVIPNYNLMGVAKAALEASVREMADDLGEEGIRVNAISAGPILTRAASGISDFRNLLRDFKEKAPMNRLIESEEVAKTALYLLSDLSSGVTGEILHVDCGFNITG